MKNIKNGALQGDMMLRRVDSLPEGLRREEADGGRYVLAHSETGHHHAIDAPPGVVQLFGSSDPLVSYMRNSRPVELRHHRDWDTHETLRVPPGTWEIRRQREWTPEGWERVID